MKLFGKSKMQKFESVVAALRKRGALLSAKRIAAQAAFDDAVAARQEMLIAGDLDDQKLAAKLQGSVDSAASALNGIADAVSALQNQIDSAEKDLAVEQQRVERQAASESLAASVASIESKLEPWLTATRAFAESLQSIAHVRFEPGQIAAYIGGCAGQAEIALAVMLDDLRRMVPAIAGGHEPIPRVPGVVVPSVVAPPPVTIRLFALKAVKWTDAAGMERFIGKFNDVNLPEKAAVIAREKGVCIELTDPRRKQLKGMSPGHLDRAWCTNLDDENETAAAEAQAGPVEQQVVHSAFQQLPPDFQQIDRGKPFIVKTPAGNPTASGEAA
jgi:hypothetical protein